MKISCGLNKNKYCDINQTLFKKNKNMMLKRLFNQDSKEIGQST